MSARPASRWLHVSGLKVTVLLSAILLAVNAVAVWGILAGRRSAREEARKELELQTLAHARALEAILATLRGDFIFLARSPPLSSLLTSLESADPMIRRWGRLDAEGTLLLFLQAHPVLERVVIADARGHSVIVAGRQGKTPFLLPPATPPPEATGLMRNIWSLGDSELGGGQIVTWLDLDGLLAIAAPGLEERLTIERGSQPPAGGQLTAQVPVRDVHWEPEVHGWLVRREDESQLIRSVERLAGRYRTTVALNLAVMTLTLVLGTVALRQVRRAARLEVLTEHQAKVRALELQLIHSERLASVGRLAAGIAHEINNPLAGMANYLSLVEEDLARGATDDLPELLAKVREGLTRAAGITRGVLAFSDPGNATKVPLDLRPVLEEAVSFVRTNPEHRAVAVTLDFPSEPLFVLGNPITLGQLFLNLLLNACQLQPDGGRVDVTVAREGRDPSLARITIADRGPGLSAAAQKHLFEPFFSTRGSSGLGLAVCHGIVADHGGEIRGANRGDGGAVFEVHLPLTTPAVTPVSPIRQETQIA